MEVPANVTALCAHPRSVSLSLFWLSFRFIFTVEAELLWPRHSLRAWFELSLSGSLLVLISPHQANCEQTTGSAAQAQGGRSGQGGLW